MKPVSLEYLPLKKNFILISVISKHLRALHSRCLFVRPIVEDPELARMCEDHELARMCEVSSTNEEYQPAVFQPVEVYNPDIEMENLELMENPEVVPRNNQNILTQVCVLDL